MGWPGLLYGVLALVVTLLPTARARWLGSAGLGAAGMGVAAIWVGGPAGGTVFGVVNNILLALGALVILGALAVGVRRNAPPPQSIDTGPPSDRRDPVLLVGLLLAAVGPHLLLVGAGILLACTTGSRQSIRNRRAQWLLLLVPAALLLEGFVTLLALLLGPAGGSVRAVADGPISPAAEHGLMALLGAGGLLMAGLRPLHRAPWRLSLAPLAAILLARLGVPAFGLGLLDWQTVAVLLLLGMLAAECWAGSWAGAAVAAGLLTLWSGEVSGVFPGSLLVLVGWLLDGGRLPFANASARWSGLAALAPALAAPFALAAALHGQVLLSFLAAVAVILGSIHEFQRRSPVR